MHRVVVIDDREGVAGALVACLRKSDGVELCLRWQRRVSASGDAADYAKLFTERAVDAVVFSPPLSDKRDAPDLACAEAVFRACARAVVKHFVLLSSASAYGASPQNPGLIS